MPGVRVVPDSVAALTAIQSYPGLPARGVVVLCDFGGTMFDADRAKRVDGRIGFRLGFRWLGDVGLGAFDDGAVSRFGAFDRRSFHYRWAVGSNAVSNLDGGAGFNLGHGTKLLTMSTAVSRRRP